MGDEGSHASRVFSTRLRSLQTAEPGDCSEIHKSVRLQTAEPGDCSDIHESGLEHEEALILSTASRPRNHESVSSTKCLEYESVSSTKIPSSSRRPQGRATTAS